MFCLAALPVMYLMSFLFTSPELGFVVATTANLNFGIIFNYQSDFIHNEISILGIVVTFVFYYLGAQSATNKIYSKLYDLFRIYPHFSYITGLLTMYSGHVTHSVCSSKEIHNTLRKGSKCTNHMCCSMYHFVTTRHQKKKKKINLLSWLSLDCLDVPKVWRFEHPGLFREITFLILTSFFSMLVILLLDNSFVRSIFLRIRQLLT